MLELDGVTVRFGTRTALEEVQLAVAEREIVCVLGPSGSGKSTLLRVVAGLQDPESGAVRLAGQDQARVPVHRRGVGLMFQDQQLFPQRDVGGNVAFGLRMHGVPAERRARRVAELLGVVGLPGAEHRAVASLSGGEQQRVALARALAPQPRLLMLDEPLGQLDRGLRERLTRELRRIFTELGTTALAVTHDQSEAFALADRVVVMEEGRIAQQGTPLEVWRQPASEFVARFLGFENVVTATVHGDGVATPWGKAPAPADWPDGEVRLLVRPTGVRLGPAGTGLRCTVEARTFRGGSGSTVTLLLRPAGGGPPLEASCPLGEAPEEGDVVGATLDPDELVLLGGA
ncbi:ABC transporter ATP-binding protein [Streptomyces sulphureus]|uniref:ABC transporter ATP-binding protein n=1 Tax=Streptomyces sulphureus TaxID=47758 RepID=UPI0003644A28|nr:ABC transporter ATP-binding protein [Streptomyces sulphureus]